MKTPATYLLDNEEQALKWLLPSLDDSLEAMPHDKFLRAWSAISYLYGGLNPDDATEHGNEVTYEGDGPTRFRSIEPRLIAPFYIKSGWPLVLAPFAEEAWRRFDLGLFANEDLYPVEALQKGIMDRIRS